MDTEAAARKLFVGARILPAGATREPAQESAMTDIDKDRALSTFLDLVQIDSPTYEERPIMERIARELEELGLAVVERPDGPRRRGQPPRPPARHAIGPGAVPPVRPHRHGRAGAARHPARARRRGADRRPDDPGRRQQGELRRATGGRAHRRAAPPAAPRDRPRLHVGRGARARGRGRVRRVAARREDGRDARRHRRSRRDHRGGARLHVAARSVCRQGRPRGRRAGAGNQRDRGGGARGRAHDARAHRLRDDR